MHVSCMSSKLPDINVIPTHGHCHREKSKSESLFLHLYSTKSTVKLECLHCLQSVEAEVGKK